MTFTQKLDHLMSQRGMSRGALSRATGIPYTTIVSFYEKGYENIKLSNVKKLASFFEVPLEYLCDDTADFPDFDTENEFAKRYAALSERGRSIVDGVIEGLLDLEAPEEEEPEIAEPEFIREYVTPAAAGYASPAEGEDYVLIPRDTSVPQKADFAVRIAGDSMEPLIPDGSRVYVERTNELIPGDVGIFFADGDMKCKQFTQDSFGNIYLLSLNRERADADTVITASSGVTVFCFGKVLLKKRPLLPEA